MYNTNPSKLDKYGYYFFEKVIPLNMLDAVVGDVSTFLMD